jgi:hypothetical protein
MYLFSRKAGYHKGGVQMWQEIPFVTPDIVFGMNAVRHVADREFSLLRVLQ